MNYGLIIRIISIVAFAMYSIIICAQFEDKTEEIGIFHSYVNPTFIGGGVVVIDFNNDGLEDLYFTGGLSSDKLLVNRGNFSFEEATNILPHSSKEISSSGGLCGDINNDGCQDLIITTFDKSKPNHIYLNDCEGGFIDITYISRVVHSHNSMGGTLLDYNLDGYLDIYINNYIDRDKFIVDSISEEVIGFDHTPADNFLYKNLGDESFSEISVETNSTASGCTLASLGYHLNGKSFFHIGNDFGAWVHPNEMLEYDALSDAFKSVGSVKMLNHGLYSMGLALGDIENDGDFDWYVTNIGHNHFFENNNGRYVERAKHYEIDNTYTNGMKNNTTSWGVVFFDAENDGDLDIYVSNGFVPTAPFLNTAQSDSNKFYVWHNEKFIDGSKAFNLDNDRICRGVVYSDLDLDGDLDLIVAMVGAKNTTNHEISYRILENVSRSGNNYLSIKLEGTSSNRMGIGSKVYAYSGSNSKVRLSYSGGTHCSQNSSILHIGMGNKEVDSIQIEWPHGYLQTLYDIPINQSILVTESSSQIEILGCMDRASLNYNSQATQNYGCQYSSTSTIILSNEIIKIFPNPSSKFITIESDLLDKELLFEIYSMDSKLKYTSSIKSENGVYSIDVGESLSNGVYSLIISGLKGNKLLSKKFIISN